MSNNEMPSEAIQTLIQEGLLDLYIIDAPPATMSTALERSLAESPSIDAVYHEPFSGLHAANKGQTADIFFEHTLDKILGLCLDIIADRRHKKPKATIIIKTMANDLSPKQYRYFLDHAKGALTLVRNPQSQMISFYNSYVALNRDISIRDGIQTLPPAVYSIFGDKMKDRAFQEKLIRHHDVTLADHFNLIQLSLYEVESDEPAWGSLYDHLDVLDNDDVDIPHITLQSELLYKREYLEDSIRAVCDTWGIDFKDNMVAEHPGVGPDFWAKTSGDRMKSGHGDFEKADPFAKKAMSSKGWRFKDVTVPSMDSIPQALQDYILATAYPVYFRCMDRDDMYGPKAPEVMMAVYGDAFIEVVEHMRAKPMAPQPKGPNLTPFVIQRMFEDPAVNAAFKDLGL